MRTLVADIEQGAPTDLGLEDAMKLKFIGPFCGCLELPTPETYSGNVYFYQGIKSPTLPDTEIYQFCILTHIQHDL